MTLGRSIALVQLVFLLGGTPAAGLAQGKGGEVGFSAGQRFASLTPVRDARERLPMLQREISVDLRDTPLADALRTIANEAGLSVTYSRNVVTSDWRVTVRARGTPVADILADAVQGSGMELLVSRNGQLVVVKGKAPQPAGSIEGTVVDGGTNQPLSDVYVILDGTRHSAETGADGRFRIADVPVGNYTLVARRIGYAPSRVAVTVADSQVVTVAIRMEQAVTRLTEVVTTATGEQRRVEVGNAIGRIQADSVALSAPVTNFADVLNARIPGVQVLPANGLAGQAPRIRVRGLSSATVTNDPIVIVDGIRFEQSPLPAGQFPQITSYGIPNGRMADLNPEDIESIEVIKGPSAATLYGTDAANGVIVITTRHGTAGPPKWTWYGETGVVDDRNTYPTRYATWGHDPTTNALLRCTLVTISQNKCVADSVTSFNVLRDPTTTPLTLGNRKEFGGNVSGGAGAVRYFVSGDIQNETGPFQMPDFAIHQLDSAGTAVKGEWKNPEAYQSENFRANLSTSPNEHFDLNANAGWSNTNQRLPQVD
ncbi:MAG TPA: DUF2012 domain-containing protein, partial [Gemmatimonadales bacterium]|nr:DUF2012 domain-containing protein [Gemmatimonadales bacterium]